MRWMTWRAMCVRPYLKSGAVFEIEPLLLRVRFSMIRALGPC